jgi:hypothetical protein
MGARVPGLIPAALKGPNFKGALIELFLDFSAPLRNGL